MPDMAVDDLLDDVFNVAATSQSTESVSVPPDIGQDPPLIPDRVLVFTSKSLLSVLTVAKIIRKSRRIAKKRKFN